MSTKHKVGQSSSSPWLVPLLLLAVSSLIPTASSLAVVVGDDPDSFPLGWSEGVCYLPLEGLTVSDRVKFSSPNGYHDVHRMASQSHYESCDFTDAILLATSSGGEDYEYTISAQDALDGEIYFSCSVGDHCSGGRQRLTVRVVDSELSSGGDVTGEVSPPPVSKWQSLSVVSPEQCQAIEKGAGGGGGQQPGGGKPPPLNSKCSDPLRGEDGRLHVSCLSEPTTMTPGGVVNSVRLLHYPFPRDHRVVSGERTWEFVQGDPEDDGISGVTPVPVNQLYIHHLAGNVILGQGTEGVRRTAPDAPFPPPYGILTGDESNGMIFHIIDLRGVGDSWLACIECRCNSNPVPAGSFGITVVPDRDPFGVLMNGGVLCCTNCTTYERSTETVDYRMRYNVSYSDVGDTEPVTEVLMLTADISPAVGKNIEFDVPQFQFLPEDIQSVNNRRPVQRLERRGAFRDLFQHDYFGRQYDGPQAVGLLRCVGHLHVAALGMWMEDAETGERLCEGTVQYGEDPDQDLNFLTAIAVDSYETPMVFDADLEIRLVTEYDAEEYHTGVMGMWFLFTDGQREVSSNEAALRVEVCQDDLTLGCQSDLLPTLSLTRPCVDNLPTSPACRFGGLCDCALLTTEDGEGNGGCGNTYGTANGDMVVNDMCADSCGCPGAADSVSKCVDTLSDNPMCKFGGFCDCEVVVNAAESTGCGGIYTSTMGDIAINDVCQAYCDACPEDGDGVATESAFDPLLEEYLVEQLEDHLRQTCRYATEECRQTLSRLYTCGVGGYDDKEDIVQAVLSKHGDRLAMKHRMLGHPSLHAGQKSEQKEVKMCVEEEEEPKELEKEESEELQKDESEELQKDEPEDTETSSSGAGPLASLFKVVAVATTFLFFV